MSCPETDDDKEDGKSQFESISFSINSLQKRGTIIDNTISTNINNNTSQQLTSTLHHPIKYNPHQAAVSLNYQLICPFV